MGVAGVGWGGQRVLEALAGTRCGVGGVDSERLKPDLDEVRRGVYEKSPTNGSTASKSLMSS